MITCSDPKHALNLVRQCPRLFFFPSLLPPPSSQLGFLWPLRKETTLGIKLSLYALVFQFCFSFKSFENNIGVFIVIFCALISKFLHQRCWKDGTRSQELHLSWLRITAVVTFIKKLFVNIVFCVFFLSFVYFFSFY